MAYNFMKLSEVDIAESVSEAAHVLVEDGGEVKRVAKAIIGGGGSSTMQVYSSATINVEELVEHAKTIKPHGYYSANYDKYALITVDSYDVHYSFDDCCGGDVYFLRGYGSYPLSTNNIVWTVTITANQYNEIIAAWKTLAGVV